MPKFFRGDTFLFRVANSKIEATDNTRSYGATIDHEKENSISKYLVMSPEDFDLTIEKPNDKKLVLSFAKLFEGMRIDICEVELSASSAVNTIDWAFELTGSVDLLQKKNLSLENKISHQNTLIDQMIEAKDRYQEEMLERVCAILDARHGGHATMIDILEHRRHEQEALSKDTSLQADVKLEEIALPEFEKVKVESISPEPKNSLSDASTQATTTDEETTQDESA